mmetsp:Transcript_16662/g.65071  ORF Transcript_16662/g.65071 Transcript_16662/m.65071 type:complete len:281 (-) Transcript_16662:1748-2590(-)
MPTWYADWPRMVAHMRFEIRRVFSCETLIGGLCSSFSVGGSVASASAPMLSMIRFTQSSWIAFSGVPMRSTAPKNAIASAATLTVSWNWRNFLMLSKMLRPHMTDLTMELKLSSVMMMSDASLAMSVPVIPIARPTWALRSAGASLAPSPVTATSCFLRSRSRRTRRSLSSGLERASTWRLSRIGSSSSSDISRKTPPSSTVPSVRMPHCRAMATAVSLWSPVTMRTMMPAFWQSFTALGTSGRSGSWMPVRPRKVSFCSGCSSSSSGTSSEVSKTSKSR